jgi:23S rRNA (cytidine1920-2'-O)/16S rRNA (cytidine1409-2'-O)-methyltransferase
MVKMRLDLLMLQKGLCESRGIAQSLIIQGRVKVNGRVVVKAGTAITEESSVQVEESKRKYVSRGGHKLEHALDTFGINVEAKAAIDVGSSTGGFTDCLLKRGASRVYAVDVGKGQIDYALRNDGRVFCLEGKNARYLKEEDIGEPADIITVDLSFISLALVFPSLKSLLPEEGCLIALVKPQFEAGRSKVKRGVVKEPDVHVEVLQHVLEAASHLSLRCDALTYSPLKGPAGNIEFLALFRHGDEALSAEIKQKIDEVVNEAHRILMERKGQSLPQ